MTSGQSVPALRADRLGKRYGHVWALRDCTFSVGSVVGLVGPNGAGKTTLLSLTVGLLAPTEGEVAVFGETSHAYTADTLARVSYLAQDHPLYRSFTVADMFRLGRSMNPRWDQALARARAEALGIGLQLKVKTLAGGQQAQVALTMALAKRAPLLTLDEPVASLDPIARLEFMRDVMAEVAETGLTVIIASHVISELERLCDWLLVLNGGRLQLAGPVDGPRTSPRATRGGPDGGDLMIWVTWRQHRAQAIACLSLFAGLAGIAIVLGLQVRTAFGDDGLPACLASSGGSGCPAAITSFVDRFARGGPLLTVINVPLTAIPGMLGAVVGAPLLGRELERGTRRLAWSQTVPRTRWLVTKLSLVTGALVVFGVAVSAVMGWLDEPVDRVTSRLQLGPLTSGGPTFTASLLCAFGLGVLAGLLLRNTIGAMVAAYFAWEIPATVAILMSGPIHIPAPAVMRIACQAGCPGASAGSVLPVTGHLGDYVLSVERSGGELVVTYLPAGRFWTEQLIQGGLFLAIAVITLGAAIWLLHRRTS